MIRRNSSRRFLSSFHRIIAFRHILAITALATGLSSCYNEPEFLGGNFIPSSDLTSVKTDTSFEVSAYTIKPDSVSTSEFTHAVLGCTNSDIFGRVKADFLTQIWMSKIKDTLGYVSPRPIPDSLVLTLRHSRTWGTNNKPINVKVYELSDSIGSSTDVYNNGLASVAGKYYPTLISNPVTYRGDSLLRIRLTDAFASKLINAPDTSYTSNLLFKKYMKGIYVTSDEYSGNDGVIYYFDNINMKMYYKKPKDTGVKDTIFTYSSSSTTPRYNHFEHDYSTARTDLKINHLNLSKVIDTTYQDSLIYIDGLGGVKGLIKFTGAKEWAQKMPIAINRAELRFDIQNHPDFPLDSLIQTLSYYNGTGTSKYSKAKNYYSIDVTVQLQNLLRGKNINDYFFIESSDFSSRYRQGIIRSGKNSKRMKLIITYSKL